MFVLADDFILTLYGPKWVDAILPLRIFLIYTLQRSVGSPVGVVYNAMGRPDIGLKFNLVFLPIYFASIFAGSSFGLVGIAAAVTVVKTISGLAAIYLASRLIGLSYSKVLRPLWPPLEMSLIMAMCVYGLKIITSRYVDLSALVSLFTFTFIGGLVLFLLLLTRYSALLDEILSVLDSLSPVLSWRVRNVLHRGTKSQLVDERIARRPDA
jgi:O-antigen/teichoic acid export membrane protein